MKEVLLLKEPKCQEMKVATALQEKLLNLEVIVDQGDQMSAAKEDKSSIFLYKNTASAVFFILRQIVIFYILIK